MLKRRILPLMCVVVLFWVGAAVADEASNLVLRDGTSILVESVEVRAGAVIVRLPNGRFQQYEVGDVDLVASRLVKQGSAEARPTEERSGLGGGGRLGRAIAPESESGSAVTITDDDVEHVDHRASRSADDEDDEDATEQVESGEGALRIAGVNQAVGDGQVTVSGQVVNDGVNDLLDVSVMASAVDIDGTVIGKGAIGITKTLAGGAAQGFSLVIPIIGEAHDVQLSGRGTAMVRPSAARSEAAESAEDAEGEARDEEDESQGDDDA